MRIIPAVDILDGRCAQLVGGKPETAEFYGDPVKVAAEWQKNGAEVLHVIDLDAALSSGEKNNKKEIVEIAKKTKVEIQVGGGIRNIDYARELLETQVDRIILGTWALLFYHEKNLEGLEKLKEDFGADRIMFAADFRKGNVVLHGWQEDSIVSVVDFIKKTEELCWGFLTTNVEVEGKMGGIDLAAITDAVCSTEKPVIASGGISSYVDVENIKATGAWGVVIGKALYEKKLDFKKLLKRKTH
ncbi:MAG: 1-(5-phosphoribosyl)-5-[(5-phosphoribosylamino)methylideneamino]imidazole-4-carboxamide isomerase [Candidatus Altiarchaeota archaeon]